MESQPIIRVGARALIFKENCVLLVKYDDETGPHYNYPGGGVNAGESVRDAVLREVLEETCVQVDVQQLIYVYEYLPEKYEEAYGEIQKLSLLFACCLLPGEVPQLPENPDPNQIGVEWVPISELELVTVYPKIAKEVIAAWAGESDQYGVFLDDVL